MKLRISRAEKRCGNLQLDEILNEAKNKKKYFYISKIFLLDFLKLFLAKRRLRDPMKSFGSFDVDAEQSSG